MSNSNDAYYALYLQEQQENKQLKARIEELEKQLVYGFYEEEWPIYSQYPNISELSDIATAEEVNGLVNIIKKAYPEGPQSI